MRFWLLYYFLSVLAGSFLVLQFVVKVPIDVKYYILYAIFCSAIYTYVPRKRSFLKFIGLELIVICSWLGFSFWIMSKMGGPLIGLTWIVSVSIFSFIGINLSSRFLSFLILHSTINRLGKYRKAALKTIMALAIVPCLYIVGTRTLLEKVRQKKNFVNSPPLDNMLNGYAAIKKNAIERCYDRRYEAADIIFAEPMLIISDIVREIKESRQNYKTIQAISSLEGGAEKFSSVDITSAFEVTDCFYINRNKYYVLKNSMSEYALTERDLDFATKNIITIQHLLDQALVKKDLELFKKLMDARKMQRNPITSKVVQSDELEFFKVIYDKEGESALSSALSIAKKGSLIGEFALSKPISMEMASKALQNRLYRGTAEEINLLLQKGATFKFDNGTQRLPIFNVTTNKENFDEIIDLYLASGNDINAKTKGGESLILVADSIHQIEYLLNKGANLNDTDDEGRNMLLRFAQFMNNPDRFKIMKFLVSKGIDKNLRYRGMTAYELIRKNHCREGISYKGREECMDIDFLK